MVFGVDGQSDNPTLPAGANHTSLQPLPGFEVIKLSVNCVVAVSFVLL
jgi:hypothetical protein